VSRHLDPHWGLGARGLWWLHWLRERYNHAPHESLDGETPAERWHRDSRFLEPNGVPPTSEEGPVRDAPATAPRRPKPPSRPALRSTPVGKRLS